MRMRGATRPGVMNRLEGQYARHLDAERAEGRILHWQYEPLRLRLGSDWKTSYNPDFLVVDPRGEVCLVEVKPYNKRAGKVYWTEDSRVKIKVAAEQYPLFHFKVVWDVPGRGWVEEVFS